MIISNTSIPLDLGKEIQVMDVTDTVAGSKTAKFAVDAESVLISLYVGSISGDLDVTVYTVGKDGEEVAVITFPTISSPTTELFLKKAASVLQRIRVVVTYTGACEFNIRARGVSAEAASVKILGQNAGKNYATTITTTPALLIPISLVDRVGIAIHNTSATKTIYMGFTALSTTVTDGWEIAPGEKLGLDIASGVEVYCMVTSGSVTAKILEAGT